MDNRGGKHVHGFVRRGVGEVQMIDGGAEHWRLQVAAVALRLAAFRLTSEHTMKRYKNMDPVQVYEKLRLEAAELLTNEDGKRS